MQTILTNSTKICVVYFSNDTVFCLIVKMGRSEHVVHYYPFVLMLAIKKQ